MDARTARRLLDRERRDAAQRLADLEASFTDIVESATDSNVDDEHDPEGATIAAERQQLGALAEQARSQVAAVDAALVRVTAGTFGVCERCGRPIGDERLEARPTATWCIDCARRTEQRARG
ncbi:conserved hypothetical protein [Nostocoides japonicum T1-X7]|uniref:Zinc finger DksA/TraR C4-type domain-containing protein n=1 Tax=Nostocoides japonicum T1-X7 TaxID=1194083 RepID=A0A077M3C6_9MICO|nr:TraR/DksA family transcriptional regulator [Tetrasphaera japonica]CCH80276.1 conserved hypothetical protein [Tetrasphaera japonica T1-X7]